MRRWPWRRWSSSHPCGRAIRRSDRQGHRAGERPPSGNGGGGVAEYYARQASPRWHTFVATRTGWWRRRGDRALTQCSAATPETAIGSSVSQSYRRSARFQRTRSSVRRRKGRSPADEARRRRTRAPPLSNPRRRSCSPVGRTLQCEELEAKAWHAFERRPSIVGNADHSLRATHPQHGASRV